MLDAQSATSNGAAPTLRYSTSELQEFRSIIEIKLKETGETLSLLESSLLLDRSNGTDDTYRTSDLEEDGQQTMEREEAARMVLRQRKYLHELKLALARIHQGSYGICRITGKRIPPGRLRAVPHATLCVEAKA